MLALHAAPHFILSLKQAVSLQLHLSLFSDFLLLRYSSTASSVACVQVLKTICKNTIKYKFLIKMVTSQIHPFMFETESDPELEKLTAHAQPNRKTYSILHISCLNGQVHWLEAEAKN